MSAYIRSHILNTANKSNSTARNNIHVLVYIWAAWIFGRWQTSWRRTVWSMLLIWMEAALLPSWSMAHWPVTLLTNGEPIKLKVTVIPALDMFVQVSIFYFSVTFTAFFLFFFRFFLIIIEQNYLLRVVFISCIHCKSNYFLRCRETQLVNYTGIILSPTWIKMIRRWLQLFKTENNH